MICGLTSAIILIYLYFLTTESPEDDEAGIIAMFHEDEISNWIMGKRLK